METLPGAGNLESGAAARSRFYQLLSLLYAFPDRELFAAIQDGTATRALSETCSSLPYPAPDPQACSLGVQGSYDDFESEYIRLFDVGAAGPPCPLYGGVYAGDRMKTMEDAVRFYNFFDLRLAPAMRELPDHITTELEFMHYLTYREALLPPRDPQRGSLLRAERDFLERHLCKWLPRMQARLARQDAPAYFLALVDCTVRFLQVDHAYARESAQRWAD